MSNNNSYGSDLESGLGTTGQAVANGLLGTFAFILNTLALVAILLSRSFPSRQKIGFFCLQITDSILGLQILAVRFIPITYTSEHLLCKARMYSGIILTYATIFSNLFITIERLLSICLPLHINRQLTWKKMTPGFVAVWGSAIVMTTSTFYSGFDGPVCQFIVTGNPTGYVILGSTICIIFLMIFVIYLYIVRLTRRHIRQIASTMVGNTPVVDERAAYQNKADLRATVTVGIIVGVFGMSYCPMGVYIAYAGLAVSDYASIITTNQVIFTTLLTFYTMNSLINPVVYFFRLKTCRQELIARILRRPPPDFVTQK